MRVWARPPTFGGPSRKSPTWRSQMGPQDAISRPPRQAGLPIKPVGTGCLWQRTCNVCNMRHNASSQTPCQAGSVLNSSSTDVGLGDGLAGGRHASCREGVFRHFAHRGNRGTDYGHNHRLPVAQEQLRLPDLSRPVRSKDARSGGRVGTHPQIQPHGGGKSSDPADGSRPVRKFGHLRQ